MTTLTIEIEMGTSNILRIIYKYQIPMKRESGEIVYEEVRGNVK